MRCCFACVSIACGKVCVVVYIYACVKPGLSYLSVFLSVRLEWIAVLRVFACEVMGSIRQPCLFLAPDQHQLDNLMNGSRH